MGGEDSASAGLDYIYTKIFYQWDRGVDHYEFDRE